MHSSLLFDLAPQPFMAKHYLRWNMWVWETQTRFTKKTHNYGKHKPTQRRKKMLILHRTYSYAWTIIFAHLLILIYFVQYRGSELYLNHRALSYDVEAAILMYKNKLKTVPVGLKSFLLQKQFLLFKEICIATDHVSENDPNVKDMNNWGANMFSKCCLNPTPPPLHHLTCTLYKHHL